MAVAESQSVMSGKTISRPSSITFRVSAMNKDQRDEWKADAENARLSELHADEVYGADPDGPEEFSAPVGEIPGQVLLEILVSLAAVDIEHTSNWIGFTIDAKRFCIEGGQLWAPSMEMASVLSEKIRRAARAHESMLAPTGT